jgi:hypothetical protein
MKFTVKYNPDFFDDLVQAVDWYNDKQAGLGDRFLMNVTKQTAQLSASALHYSVKYDDIRCFCIKRFPFVVHYRIHEPSKTVRVEALFHTSRDPKIWDDRIKE